MKTKKLERWLLLEQTGELSARRQRLLMACPEAQEKRAGLNSLRMALPVLDAELPLWTVKKIDSRLHAERRSAAGFSKLWKPALAMAVCLILVAGIVNFHGESTSSAPVAVVVAAGVDVWNDPLEEDLSRLETQIAALSGEPFDIMEM